MSDISQREQRIRERAYHLWQKEGSPEGREQEFWERARLLEEEEERRPARGGTGNNRRNDAVTEASEESFPASDPPSYTGVTGPSSERS